MNAIAKTSLYYSEGSSDKEYHAEIVEVAGGNVVNFRYGRRGASLTVGTKTSAPVDFAQAKKIYDKLVKEKTSKGYTPDVSGAAYQGTENAGSQNGLCATTAQPDHRRGSHAPDCGRQMGGTGKNGRRTARRACGKG